MIAAVALASGCSDTSGVDPGATTAVEPDTVARGSGATDPVDGPYQEPEWMLFERQRQIDYQTVLNLCLERDIEMEIMPEVSERVGGVQFERDGTATVPDDWASRPGHDPDLVARSDALAVCAGIAESRIGLPQLDPTVVYDRMHDTHRCLQAEGYPQLAPLPAEDELVPELSDKLTHYYGNLWMDGMPAPSEPWDPGEPLVTPYRLLAQQNPDIGGQEWYRLKDTCVEFGVSYAIAFLDEGDR